MRWPMNFLPKLLAVLAMLLPPGSGENSNSIAPGPPAIQRADQGDRASDSVFRPAHLPPASESFFECLDESALDEEDSDSVEQHGIATLPFLDFETPLLSDLFSSYLPANPHSQLAVITPILRC
jgi:hypothetical protein